MRALITTAALAVLLLGSAQAGPAEKAAKALFDGKADAKRVAKVWKKKRVKPDKALKLVRGLFPLRKGKTNDHTVTLEDSFGRRSDVMIGLPKSPDSTGKYGVVVLLHGLGGNARQVFNTGQSLAPPNSIVVAPNAQKVPGAMKYEDLRFAAAANLPIMKRFPHWWSYQTDAFPLLGLNYVLEHYPVDTNKVVLLGYSMGGFGTWNIGLRYHDRFAGLAPLAGGISREEYLLGKDKLVRKLLDNAEGLPTFFVHGDADKVVPCRFDKWNHEDLTARGLEHIYREVPGGKHVLSDFLSGDGLLDELTGWVKTRVRDPQPKVVAHRTLGSYHSGAYWLRIDAYSGDSGYAKATAKPEENLIEVETDGATALTLYLDERFDPKKRVRVVVDGKERFKGKVKPSLEAVADSFARTRDPLLVYDRAIQIKAK